MTNIFNALTWMSLLAIMWSFSFSSNAAAYPLNYNDGELLQIMRLANEAEIKTGKEAMKRAESAEVKEFGKMMVTEHSKNFKAGKAISKSEKIKMEMSALNAAQRTSKLASLANLKARKGKNFDQAYMKGQVEMHQDLLNEIDKYYIPAAKNAKVKSYLEETKKHVQTHLEKARALYGKIFQP